MPASVLLVEDTASDVTRAVEVLKDRGEHDVQVQSNSSSAIAVLRQALGGEVPFPKAIILDLNLAMSNGFEVLRFYHSHEELQKSPLLVWSVVDGDTEKTIASLLGAKRFVSKMAGPKLFSQALDAILPITK